VETFEAETENPLELQREGWQTILNNFKAYVEKTPEQRILTKIRSLLPGGVR
jgi:hypothetical protein